MSFLQDSRHQGICQGRQGRALHSGPDCPEHAGNLSSLSDRESYFGYPWPDFVIEKVTGFRLRLAKRASHYWLLIIGAQKILIILQESSFNGVGRANQRRDKRDTCKMQSWCHVL